jgi:hypothetical protein
VADQTLTRLKGRLGEAHPELIAANENRLKIREQLDALLRGYESSLEIAYNEAEARVAELRRSSSRRPRWTRSSPPATACGRSRRPRRSSTTRRAC